MTNAIPNVPRDLKPCPFCGSKKISYSTHQIGIAVGCDSCGAVCEIKGSKEQCAEAWNTRAPSPAGVDGCEVVAYIWSHEKGIAVPTMRNKPPFWPGKGGYTSEPLCRLSDAQAIIDWLRGEVERLQMQLAACGVVALANTIESAGEARQMHPDYMSASCSDVADAVDREIALRAERDDLHQQLAVRDEEIERIRVQLMTIASAEPARHSIEWAKAMAATGGNDVYAQWREAFDQRDQQAHRIGELEGLLRACHSAMHPFDNMVLEAEIDAALSAGKEGE